MKVTAEQRRTALKKRTQRGISERGQKGLGRKSVLDYSKAGDHKIVKFEIKVGKDTNYIDILPFEITQPWYKDLRSVSGSIIGLDVGFTDYKLEIPVHRNVGENNDIFLCLRLAFGKKCPICEEMYAEWDKDQDEQDAKKIQALKPSWRCFYNVYDYDSAGTPVMLWEDISYYLFEEMLQEAIEAEDDGIVTFSDLEMGSSIEFKAREKKLGKNAFNETHSIKFVPREPYDDTLLKETFSLDAMLIIPTYEEVAKAHLGMESDNDEEIPEPTLSNEKEAPKRTRQRSKIEGDKDEKEAPWSACPSGAEFGTDCNTTPECSECNEDLFQECLTKQAKLKTSEDKPRLRQKAKTTNISEDEQPVRARTRKR